VLLELTTVGHASDYLRRWRLGAYPYVIGVPSTVWHLTPPLCSHVCSAAVTQTTWQVVLKVVAGPAVGRAEKYIHHVTDHSQDLLVAVFPCSRFKKPCKGVAGEGMKSTGKNCTQLFPAGVFCFGGSLSQ